MSKIEPIKPVPLFLIKKKCRVVVVDDSILSAIKVNLDKLLYLWLREGAEKIFVYKYPKGAGNSPLPIRKFLQEINSKYWLEGVFLLGELPVAFFDGDPTGQLYTSDYFFMELQGAWIVNEGNKVFIRQKLAPTISAGRVFIGSQTGQSAGWQLIDCYNNYLKKAIDYRIKGETYRKNRKVALISNFGGIEAYIESLRIIYPPSSIEDVFENVNSAEYKRIIESPHDWVFLAAHGNGEHQMADNTYWDASAYSRAKINVNIFQFVSCGIGQIAWHGNNSTNAQALTDPVTSNILGNPKGGVQVFSPSIAGTGLLIRDLNNELREGDTFGEALRKNIKKLISENYSHLVSLYGDPFLTFNPVDTRIYTRKKSIVEQVFDRRKIEYV